MTDLKSQVPQVATVWSGVGLVQFLNFLGVNTWADFSAMVVALYTLLLLIVFVWRLVRNTFFHRGKEVRVLGELDDLRD